MVNDLIKQIEATENTIKALQDYAESLRSMMEKEAPIKWSPVGGGWWVNADGTVKKGATYETAKEFGHERPTQQQAERAAIEMRKFNRLLALRDELGAANWVIGKTNYYIYYDYINGNYRVCTNSSTQIMGAVYFTSQESVKKACDMLNSGEVEL